MAPDPEGLIYVTPSGRVWDAERFLWAEDLWLCPHGKTAAEEWCDHHGDHRQSLRLPRRPTSPAPAPSQRSGSGGEGGGSDG